MKNNTFHKVLENNLTSYTVTVDDASIIKSLQDMGYAVVVNDLSHKDFSKRYDVYQNLNFSELKKVIIDKNGAVIALQG